MHEVLEKQEAILHRQFAVFIEPNGLPNKRHVTISADQLLFSFTVWELLPLRRQYFLTKCSLFLPDRECDEHELLFESTNPNFLQVRADPPIRFAEWSGDKNLI